MLTSIVIIVDDLGDEQGITLVNHQHTTAPNLAHSSHPMVIKAKRAADARRRISDTVGRIALCRGAANGPLRTSLFPPSLKRGLNPPEPHSG